MIQTIKSQGISLPKTNSTIENGKYTTSIHQRPCPPDPFIVPFFDDGTPLPVLLGTSNSRDGITNFETSIKRREDYALECFNIDFRQVQSPHETTPPNCKPSQRAVADWKARIERIIAATKRTKSKHKPKNRKADERLLRPQDAHKLLEKTQRYLGLLPRKCQLPPPDGDSPWSEQQLKYRRDLKECGWVLDPLDTSRPAQFALKEDVVFIAIDVEAYEHDNRRITEVGVSTLDTPDLTDVVIGEGGGNWISHIHSRHFRIREHVHLQNRDYCPGNANDFRFGSSEFVSLNEAADVVDECFRYPWSSQARPKLTNMEVIVGSAEAMNIRDPEIKIQEAANSEAVSNVLSEGQHQPSRESSHEAAGIMATADIEHTCRLEPNDGITQSRATQQLRKIILVGHDLQHDIEYLRDLGSRVIKSNSDSLEAANNTSPLHNPSSDRPASNLSSAVPKIHLAVDTATLHKFLTGETNTPSLARVCFGVGREGLWGLHNAGNDARYTMEALVGLAVKGRILEDEKGKKKAEEMANWKGEW